MRGHRMIDWKKPRVFLIAAAGVYLIYTACSLFGERYTDSAMPLWVNCLFSALFALAAIGTFVYAFILWKRTKAEEDELMKQAEREDHDPRDA